jgi:hypothetical protein
LEKIFDGNVTTTGNITLNKSISNYDELLFVTNFTRELGESYITTFNVDVSIFKNIGNYTAARGVLLNDWSKDSLFAQVKYVDDMTIDVDAIQVVSIVEIYGVKLEGSGGGTSEGEGVEIYSEDEYIVGKWIDGKKLYQKTYRFSTPITIPSSGWFTTNIPNSDKDTYVEVIGISPSKTLWNFLGATGDTGNYVNILNPRSTDIQCESITLRYTKTVETDAPAWGGSVNNYYANFIDTNRVIDSGSYQGSFTYTATEDCFINIAVVMSANDSATITIDRAVVTSGWCASLNTINPILPLKKGQTLVATASASNTSSYTVYGISYSSGGSSSGSKIEYSTEEKEVGTWIDGSKIYQKTFVLSSFTSGTITINASDLNIKSLVDANGEADFIQNGEIVESLKFPHYISGQANSTIRMAFGNIQILHTGLNEYTSGYVTVRYTKTTT